WYAAYSDTIARLGTLGDVDQSFAGGGIFTPADALLVQPDGKILALGGTLRPVRRYFPDGAEDREFNISVPAFQFRRVDDWALQSDGKLIIIGYLDAPIVEEANRVVRLNTDGTWDASFGTGGYVTIGAPNLASSDGRVVVQGDGKIVVGVTARFTDSP